MVELINNARKIMLRTKRFYIFGAGLYGRNLYAVLRNSGLDIDGWIVSSTDDQPKVVLNKNVFSAKEMLKGDVGILIGMNRHNAESIRKIITDSEVKEENLIWGYQYIEKESYRGGYNEEDTIEITTRIGCSINCKYCPQSILLREYYKKDTQRKSVLSYDDFLLFLERMPSMCTLIFSGMAEPFLNPRCIDMIETACFSGRKVDVYTTLTGMSMEDAEKICSLPVNFVGIHVADSKEYANIPLSEEYYNKLEMLLGKKKVDGSPLVGMCNAQSYPEERVKAICDRYGYYVLTELFDRAGNLAGETLIHKRELAGALSCSMCGQKLNHNVLLPDGTVLLCCMDYGMKHVIGNLNDESYEEIMNGDEIIKIKKAMYGEKDIDLLCRNCSCATCVYD